MRLRDAILMAAAAVSPLLAQAPDHPVDRLANKCYEKADTPARMAECAASAAELWSGEVEKNAKELGALLGPEGRKTLEAAQAKWVEFRQAEARSIAAVYGSMKGAAASVMSAEDQLELVRARALELKKFIDLVKESRR